MTRFALLLSLLALGALGLVACDDDDQTATAETEVITSNFGQDLPGRGPTAIAGGNACREWRRGPGDIFVEINSLKGVIRCREAQRVLKNYYRDPGSNTHPWSCEDYGEVLVQCMKPGGTAFNGTLSCSAPAPGRDLSAPGSNHRQRLLSAPSKPWGCGSSSAISSGPPGRWPTPASFRSFGRFRTWTAWGSGAFGARRGSWAAGPSVFPLSAETAVDGLRT